jgi:hypothetical protein
MSTLVLQWRKLDAAATLDWVPQPGGATVPAAIVGPPGRDGSATAVPDGDKGDIVTSGGGTAWSIDPAVLSAFGRTLIDDAGAAAARATLGLGNVDNTADSAKPVSAAQAAAIAAVAWTTVKLASDATSSSVTPSGAGLGFTPAASKSYEIHARLLIRAAAITTGVQIGLSGPTAGIVDGAYLTESPNSAIANAIRTAPIVAGNGPLAAATGVAVANTSYLARIDATLVMGAGASGTRDVIFASEVAGSVVTLRAGSLLRFREI